MNYVCFCHLSAFNRNIFPELSKQPLTTITTPQKVCRQEIAVILLIDGRIETLNARPAVRVVASDHYHSVLASAGLS
jgi:hypothetical protein